MSKPIDYKKAAREKKVEELKQAAYARKITNQYDLLKKWDKGELTGVECVEAIELEGKVFRLENDLSELRKKIATEEAKKGK